MAWLPGNRRPHDLVARARLLAGEVQRPCFLTGGPLSMHRTRLSRSTLGLWLVLTSFLVVSCWDDESTPTGPSAAPVDTTRRDTSKIDTSKKDTAKKDTTKVDTSKTIVGPASSDSLAAGQKSKDLQLGGAVGAGLSVTWVKFQATSGHTYTFTTLPRGQATAQVFLLLGPDTLAQVANPLVADSVVFPSLRAGTHLVRVVGPSGTKIGLKVGENTLLPLYFEGADSYEPDNDTKHATVWDLKFPATQRRTTHFAGAVDTDMIRLSLDSGTTLTVAAQGTSTLPRLGRPTTTLLDAQGKELTWNEKQEGIWTYASFQARTAFVRLVGSRSTDPYNVTISSSPGLPATAVLADAYEPDSTVALAPRIPLDTIGLQRTLHGDVKTQDADLVRFHADSGTLVLLRVESPNLPSLELHSVDGIRQILRDSVSSGRKAVKFWLFACARSADYALKIQGSAAVAYRIAATATAGLPTWTVKPDSLEPDDSRSRAIRLKSEELYFERNLPDKDEDLYAMDVDSGTVWSASLQLAGSKATGSVRARVLDADSVEVDAFSTSGTERNVWSRQFVRAGRYYLSLTGVGSLDVRYYLHSVAAQGTDPLEPDSSRPTARALATDGGWLSRSLHPMDEDWMKVQVRASNRVTFHLERSSNLASLGFHLYGTETGNQNETPMGYFWCQNSNSDSLSIFAPSDTTLYFRVHADNLSTTFTNWTYRIRARMEPVASDALEPDQSKTAARVLTPDTAWLRRNLFPGDQDWMAIDVPANKIVHFQATEPAFSRTSSVSATIFGADGALLVGNWGGTERSYYVAKPSRFLVNIAADTSVRSVVDYGFRAWLQDYPDAFEPDNPIAQAVALALDSSLQTRISFPNDSDWIRVPWSAMGIRSVQLTAEYGRGKAFGIYRANGALVKSVSTSDAEKPVVIAGLDDTATYFLFVPPSSTYQPYTARGWIKSDPDTLEKYDTPQTALWLGKDSIVRFAWSHDTDYFRYHLEPGRQVLLRTIGCNTPMFSRSGIAGPWDGTVRPFQVATATDLLVRVTGWPNSTGFDRYSIRVDTFALDTSLRYSSASRSLRLPADSVERKLTNSYEDTVWVKIPLSASGTTVRVSSSNSVQFNLFRQDSTLLGGAYNSAIDGFGPPDSVVLVRLDPLKSTNESKLAVFSILAYPMTNDLFEPDSGRAEARLPDASQELSGTLVWNDEDWFRLPDLGSAQWTLESLTDTRFSMEYAFYSANGDSLSGATIRGAVTPASVPVPATASLGYVRLHATPNLFRSLPYRIRLAKP